MRAFVLKISVVLAGAAVLAACSKGPSNKEVEASVRDRLEQATSAVEKMSGAMPAEMGKLAQAMKTQVHSVKSLGCQSDGNNAYKCDVEVDLENAMTGRTKQVLPLRMVKGSDGKWLPAGL